jgi:hypothetical protein
MASSEKNLTERTQYQPLIDEDENDNNEYKNYIPPVASLRSERFANTVITITLGLIFLLGFLVYLWMVHLQFSFYKSYSAFNIGAITGFSEQSPPGYVRDTRYSFFWFMCLFGLLRFPLGLLFIWLLKRIKTVWKLNLFAILLGLVIILEIVNILGSIGYWATCNNPYIIDNPCNDKRYCQSYWASWGDRCLGQADTSTVLPVAELTANPYFIRFFWFGIGFLVFELLMGLQFSVILEIGKASR